MPDKQITDLVEKLTPTDNDELIGQSSGGGTTFKSKLSNLLKNVFTVRDVYGEYLVQGLSLEVAGGNQKPSFVEFRNGLFLWEFNNSAQPTAVYFVIHIQHDIKPNTDMTFHVHWTHHQAAPTGNMKWFVDYTIAKGYGTAQFAAPTTMSTVQTAGPQYTHHITNDDDMVIPASANLEPDSVIIGKLYRQPTDVEDTFNNGVFLLHADIHYVISRTGTTERNRPFISGGFPA